MYRVGHRGCNALELNYGRSIGVCIFCIVKKKLRLQDLWNNMLTIAEICDRCVSVLARMRMPKMGGGVSTHRCNNRENSTRG